MKARKRVFVIPAFVFAATFALYLCGAFSFLEYKSYDDRMKRTAPFYHPSDSIALVVLDQASLDWAKETKGWGWPWPRSAYGDMVRYFDAAGATAVCFDMMYTEPSLYGASDDENFAAANRHYKKTAIAVHFLSSKEAVYPIEPIRSSAGVLSSVVSTSDSDGVIRRSSYGYEFEGKTYPSLGVSPLLLSGTLTDEDVALHCAQGSTAQLRYAASIDGYIPYSASQILRSWEAVKDGLSPFPDDLIEPQNFAGTSVFFGVYAPGLYDICSTPVSQTYPGVGTHVSLLNTLESGSEIRPVNNIAVCLILILASIAGSLVIELSGSRKKHSMNVAFVSCGAAAILLFIALFSYVPFAFGIWIPFVAPLFSFASSFVSSVAFAYHSEGRQKRFIKSAFSQYLSSTVIDQIIADPSKLKLGGTRSEITIYFSDVQGFTSISEGMDPSELTSLLNDYLGEMTDIILESGGTLDKYEGDALIAFWNAPIAAEDHARRALEAAMRCQSRLNELRPELQKRAGKPLFQRIGMNTGYAVVGNMGSSRHFNYTMLGDAVNLASRLEGLNKQFGTYTMCSDATRKAAVAHGTSLCFRELARAAVVGKKEAVTVYEPMMPEVYEARRKELSSFDAALRLFYEGSFKEAFRAFNTLSDKDAAAAKYASKCRELSSLPAPENWSGVWVATSK